MGLLMQCLILLPATEHRAIPAPGRAGTQGEQRCRVKVEATRGNPGSALWLYAEGGMVLFLCLLSLIWVYDDATQPRRRLKLREILRVGSLL